MFSCVLFDLDQTLLRMEPSLTEKVYEVVVSAHPEVTMEAVERAYASSEIWQGRQIQKENETGIRASDEEYFAGLLSVYRQFLPVDNSLSEPLFAVLSRRYSCRYRLMPML